jgi:hypothetical protein
MQPPEPSPALDFVHGHDGMDATATVEECGAVGHADKRHRVFLQN